MRKIVAIAVLLSIAVSCSNNSQNSSAIQNDTAGTYHPSVSPNALETDEDTELNDEVENERGIGEITHVELSPNLDKKMADEGSSIYDLKCYSCHRLDNTRLVGPGWQGVTQRRTPEWIMNFSINTDEMLNKDAQAQAMLEICLIRMPNQNLSETDARAVLEFMRENDGVK